MKVLVTGGCGFIGSHACEYYVRRGDRVVCLDNMTKHELSRMSYLAPEARDHNWNLLSDLGVELVRGDIRDTEMLSRAADGCDFIIHTAAQPAMTISVENPELDFTTNVAGTFNVLELARTSGIPAVSCATIHIYGNRINETLREGDTRYERTPAGIDENERPVQGTLTPLHASKRAGDIYVQTYIDTYGLDFASFRLTGLYGSRQFGGEDHGWVAHFTISALTDRPITIFGTGKQTRDILYATDLIEAFDAFYRTRKAGVYNIGGGPDHAISLVECIEELKGITGRDIDVRFDEGRLGDLLYFVCDTARAREQLGWQPRVKPARGIAELAEWVQQNLHFFRGEGK